MPRTVSFAVDLGAQDVGHSDPMNPMDRIGEYRAAKGLTWAAPAERSGVSRSNLHRLQADPAANVTLATVKRLASALEVPLELLVAGREAMAGEPRGTGDPSPRGGTAAPPGDSPDPAPRNPGAPGPPVQNRGQ